MQVGWVAEHGPEGAEHGDAQSMDPTAALQSFRACFLTKLHAFAMQMHATQSFFQSLFRPQSFIFIFH